MNCETCHQTKPIPSCIDEIVIGYITLLNSPIIIKLLNAATGRKILLSETSAADGLITIDTSDLNFMEGHYVIQVASESDYSNDLPITISGIVAPCIDLIFENCNEVINSAILELKA